MNVLDTVLLVLMATAAWTGHRMGLLARALSWAGALVGLVVATRAVPAVLSWWPDGSATTRLLIGLGTVLLCTSVGSALAELIGLRIRRRVHRTPFGVIDRAGGAVAGALSVLLVVWFLLPALANTPGSIAAQARQSTVVGWVQQVAPEPPDTSRALGRLVDQSGFPDVFADLRPAPIIGPPPDQIPVDEAVVAQARSSTVNVEAFGCGSGFEGSGFVVADGIVATNAHVIAGSDEIRLRRPDGEVVPATILHSDSNRDLALLEAPGIGRPALPLRDPVVDESGATIGYPGGQDVPRVAPAVVRDDRSTVGRDLYGSELVTRRVLFLAANLQQGDSGSALIGGDGAVMGVVFAVSPDDPDVAYALHPQELRDVLAAAPNRSTGSCA